MLNNALRSITIAAALVVLATQAQAQDTRILSGVVTDSGRRPIPYVNIDGGPRYRTVSNASGEWTLRVPTKERLEVAVRRIGFLPDKFRVDPGASDTTINTSLQQLAVMMNTQVIRAREQVRTLELRGYYERMLEKERGALVGEFITPEEIEMRKPQRVTQLLEQRRGIRVERMGRCQIIDECYRIMGQNSCAATVYLDGQRLNSMGTAAGDPSGAPAVDGLIPVTGVSAIEVYPRGSSAPAKYQSLGGTCAVVLIWTK